MYVYVYIYICMYIFIYVCIYVCTCTYTYILYPETVGGCLVGYHLGLFAQLRPEETRRQPVAKIHHSSIASSWRAGV